MARRLTKTQRHRRNQRRTVFERDGYRCVSCHRHSPPGGLTLDHIIPRAAGGTSVVGNLQTMCFPCNQEKADRLSEKFELHPWHPERVGAVGRRLEAA